MQSHNHVHCYFPLFLRTYVIRICSLRILEMSVALFVQLDKRIAGIHFAADRHVADAISAIHVPTPNAILDALSLES
ncbi:hypothetical protein J2776_002407 [Paraburkholderia caledonica]|uniref:Uncharacterized protein n=1 Tax=Paraburkholderia caledonica TaxID=134536 RepID=A0ABU1KXP2_9BURK|nr:hypothetical protein [Paraburkholderia caledonica]